MLMHEIEMDAKLPCCKLQIVFTFTYFSSKNGVQENPCNRQMKEGNEKVNISVATQDIWPFNLVRRWFPV